MPALAARRRPGDQGRADHARPRSGASRRASTSLFVNFFPDNPLWMIPFECIEAYDVFFTKERYAMRSLESVGLRNLHYLPMYCVPALHHPVTLDAPRRPRASARRSPSSAAATPTASGSCASWRDYPLRVWGGGWDAGGGPGGPAPGGRAGRCSGATSSACTAASTLSLNHHHPMNDIVGVNTRAFELAASRRLPGGGPQGGAGRAVQAGRGGRRLSRPGRAQAHSSTTTWPTPTRRAPSARTRARARAHGAHAAPPDRGDARHRRAALREATVTDSLATAPRPASTAAATFPLDYRLECTTCAGLLELALRPRTRCERAGPARLHRARASGATRRCCPSPIRRTG